MPQFTALDSTAAEPDVTASEQQQFRIAELAAEFGVTARTIRFYESHDLLSPVRDGQNRIYSRQDRAKLGWILRGKRVGFSLNDIKEMLDLYDVGDNRMKQRAVTLAKCRQRIADLQSQRADIDSTIAELQAFCITVETMVTDQDNAAPTEPWNTPPPGETA
ncbi:MAG: MerR family DNA-binding transcriptional regulator [Pseudomonadota bacterium]